MIDLKEVEEKRVRYENEFIVAIIAGVFVLTVGLFYALENAEDDFLFFLGFGAVIFVLYCLLLYRYFRRKWDELFKSEVLAKLLKKHFKDFVFKPFYHHSIDEFKRSMLFKDYPKPDRYEGGNYIGGIYEGVNFSLSWLNVEYETTDRDSEGNTSTSYHKIFMGLFIKTESFKEIEGYVLVYPFRKKLEKLVKGAGVFLHSPGKRLKMNHPEFNKYFSVYASSDFNAYYILDHAFMERLMKLKDSLGKSIRLSFQGKTLYIAIEDMNFLATPSLFKSLEEVDLDSYVKELRNVLDFLDYLKLNQRLGTSL